MAELQTLAYGPLAYGRDDLLHAIADAFLEAAQPLSLAEWERFDDLFNIALDDAPSQARHDGFAVFEITEEKNRVL